ncbi:SMP-30/gluconolactonase/LRE family protein [Massilia sp. Dwa41.01b]|nr:SMP-30/gluconolactonase/LRE family protein [Massilia sp. Dwa41.01b]QNB01450.1 SMP-30/gluconolactonase/LRE family protein [Massilia sp. Se16.2.3]
MERIGEGRALVGECPVWSALDGCWYWVDIVARTVWRLGSEGQLASWTADEMVACIAPSRDGTLVAGMETGLFRLALGEAGKAGGERLAVPASLGEGMRFNDGRCDRQGRFWSGTMFMDMAAERAVGQLYRYSNEDGLSEPVVSGLLTQNGLAFSPDGRTMYLSDSHPQSQQVWAFDYDLDAGLPSNRRPFVDMRTHPGRPDGAAIDADGCYWTCGNDAGVILRFTPDGKLDRTIAVPMAKPSMCSFGGTNLDTLLVTSISAGQDPADPWAGATIMLRPGVQGVAETPFGG